MIEIGANPNLVGALTWHGFFTFVAAAIAIGVAVRLAKEVGLKDEIVYSMLMWAVPGGIIGSRLLHVIDSWSFYSGNVEEIFFVWQGGVTIYGAIIGGTISGAIYAWIKGYPVLKLMDVAAPALLIAQAIGRIGDVINGEHPSRPTDLPWAWVYTNPESPGSRFPASHPAIAYEMLMDIGILALIWVFRKRLKPDGMTFLAYAAVYSFGRFFLQTFFRDDGVWILKMQAAAFISLVVLGITIPIIVWRAYSQIAPKKGLPVEAVEDPEPGGTP